MHPRNNESGIALILVADKTINVKVRKQNDQAGKYHRTTGDNAEFTLSLFA